MPARFMASLSLLCAFCLAQDSDVLLDASRFDYAPPWELRRDTEGAHEGTLLVAPAQLDMLQATLSPNLTGPHMIYVGLHYQKPTAGSRYRPAVHVRLDSDDYRVYLETLKAFAEAQFKAADMTGRSLIIASLSQRPVFVDYVRFVPMTDAQFAAYERRRTAPHAKDVVGINDVNVWMWDFTSRTEWDFKDIVGQHKFAGFNRLYWMANAGALFYHSEIGTRYRRDKRDFTPRSGYMIENFRPLEAGVKYAHEQGLEILGWYRLNNNFASPSSLAELGDGLNSEFFMQHPEYRCVYPNGSVDHSRYSFAYPQVRAYVRAICVEMVHKGVDGLLLDLLRHPPLARYEPPLIEGYQALYGIDPREIKPADRDEYSRWIKYRAANCFTLFVRELRDDLAAIGKPVPIGIRCALAEPGKNIDWCMDVEALVKEGLIGELCLMNGYLGKPDLTHRPDEIARVSEPYFMLCEGRDIKLIGGMHGPSVSPDRTLEYTRFFHEAGYDGVAIYESDEMINRLPYRPTYQRLKLRQRITEPWLSVSSSSGEQLVPWRPVAEQGNPWWQMNLPAPDTLSSMSLSFAREGYTPATVTLLSSEDGRAWRQIGRGDVSAETRQATISCRARGKHFRVSLDTVGKRLATLTQARLSLAAGTVTVGEQRDGKVRIVSHTDGQTVEPRTVFEAKLAGDPATGHVTFLWDGAPIRVEREAPFTWPTPPNLRAGRHKLSVRAPTRPLSPSVDEISVTVDAPALELEALPEGSRVIFQADFDETPLGAAGLPAGMRFSRGYGAAEEPKQPEGYARIRLKGGSPALHLSWSGEGPRMVAGIDLEQPVPKGMVEFDFMVPDTRYARLAGLFEGAELNGAIYLNDSGSRMTYNSGRDSHAHFAPEVRTRPGLWRHVKWEWDAAADTQVIYIENMQTPVVTGSAMRRKTAKGITRCAFFFFEGQPADLYIDNVRAAAY